MENITEYLTKTATKTIDLDKCIICQCVKPEFRSIVEEALNNLISQVEFRQHIKEDHANV